MITTTTAILLVVGSITVVWMAMRDHGALRASRRGILDACRPLLDDARITHGGDDFPSLHGMRDTRRVHAALIPDTMTIRRLPQLWLSLTYFEKRPQSPEFAVLVRPAGTEFYSLTSQYDHRLAKPRGLPDEVLIRGSGPAAQPLLDRTASVLGRIFSDPKVKEVAVTARGLRLVWQANEGRRGEHLLLRQSVFDGDGVAARDFEYLLDQLQSLSAAVDRVPEALAS
ncbi:MAG: hypothetical protein IKE66_07145 [Hyphomicrobium sp.]|nr:hypothetical protein [Hyphomicrobium sp.]